MNGGCVLAIFAFAVIPGAKAQTPMSTAQFFEIYDHADHVERVILETGILGADSGFIEANSELRARGRAPIYCQPEHLALTTTQIVAMIRHEAGADPAIARAPMSVAMMETFKRTFPCSESP